MIVGYIMDYKKEEKKLDLEWDQITDIEFDGIDHKDYPDYCDAYISSALYKGREATEEELDSMNYNQDFLYEELMNYIY